MLRPCLKSGVVMKRYLLLLVFAVGLAAGPAGAALDEQRARFVNAWDDIRAGKSVDVDELERTLADYPLTPYLRFHELSRRLSQTSPERIQAFLDAHADLPISGQLAYRWQLSLARQGDWEVFRAVDRGQGGATMECYRLRAERHAQGVSDDWLDRARALWTVAYSQPNACDPVFAELYDRKAISAERGWERVSLIMQAGDTGLARALSGRLERNERRWLEYWLQVTANPERALADPGFDVSTERGRQLVNDGFRRLGARDQERAMALLDRYRDRGWLEPEQDQALRRHVALRAAYSRHENALDWFDALPEAAVTDQVREWAARVALGRQDWTRLLGGIWALPPEEQGRAEWRYWKAQSLLRTGEESRGQTLLKELAGERHYYGFLAADALGLPYSMNHRPGPRDDAMVDRLAERPGVQRAQEFLAIGFYEEARREWHAALSDADAAEWAQAAQLARDWGWYDRMIHAANRAGLHDALELRFPLAYRELMAAAGRGNELDLALAYALMRKESAFVPDARSRVGALGLMQVMPATGSRVAERLGLDQFQTNHLLEPDTNVRLGAAYLQQMLERFQGNLIMASAAYNAGPNRVDGWMQRNAGQPAEVWIENITFGETRDYVKSVLAFRAVFDWQLYGEPRRLAGAMPLMPGAELQLALGDGD